MKSRNILILVISLTLIIVAMFGYLKKNQQTNSSTEMLEVTKQENLKNSESPVFVWNFEDDDSLNLDGNPQTNIYIEAKYPNGVVLNKLVDTTAGSCNILPEVSEDIVPYSSIIQCYSAGLGYRYKIIKEQESYIVQRKTFEEALPNYNPPVYEYETVLEFSL